MTRRRPPRGIPFGLTLVLISALALVALMTWVFESWGIG